MVVLSPFLSYGTGRGPASVPDAASLPKAEGGEARTKQKNLADESGCKPLIRQDTYFFGVIASLPHIYLFFGVDLAFHKIVGLSLCLGNDRVGDRRFN